MSLRSKNLYLYRNNQFIYYYRRAIPEYLRHHFGHLEIKKSLKTRDKSTAIVRYGMMAAQVELMFHQLRGGEAVTNDIDPSVIIGIKKEATAIHREGEATAIMSGVVQALRGKPLKFDSGRVVEDAPIRIEGNKLLRLDGSEVDDFTIVNALAYADSVGIPKMVDESRFVTGDIKATVSWHEPTAKEKAARAKEERSKLEKLGLLDAVLGHDASAVQVAPRVVAPVQQMAVAPEAAKSKKKKRREIKFSELYENYLVYRANTSDSWNKDSRKQFELFQEVHGDINVSEIDHLMITEYIDLLQFKIPANVRKIFKHQTIHQIMAMNHKAAGRKMMSPGNINKYVSQLSGLFTYAVNRGYMKENYASNKRVKDPVHAKDKRDPYTIEEIKTIFRETEPWASNDRRKPEVFWINLIGLFTGARLGEICQLRTSDVREIKEGNFSGWVIEVNEEGFQKSVKTRNSIRLIPLHSKLVEIGFLDYVKKRRQGGFGQLWDLEPHPDRGWSHLMSKRIGYAHKAKAGVDKTFHNWRHTVSDVLMKDDSVRKEEQEAFIGHAIDGESMNRYGKGFSLVTLKRTVECIQYPELDLSHLIEKP